MKNVTILSICIAIVLSLLFAFNSNQTAKQYPKDNKLRKEIMIGIVNNQLYTDEMMVENVVVAGVTEFNSVIYL